MRLLPLLIALFAAGIATAAERLVVHEWGTFTSLQDEQGNTLGGINVEDEPLPPFVHRLDPRLLVGPTSLPPVFVQGAPAAHTGVTMRLETPVIYFHLPENQTAPMELDLRVEFSGGWLTEFYPNADSTIDGAPATAGAADQIPLSLRTLDSSSASSLTWNKLRVGTAGEGPTTDSQVWLAPRRVDAANLTTAAGEAERYLFYRGVGHVEAPIQVSQAGRESNLLFIQQQPSAAGEIQPPLWLLDVRSDGAAAYRVINHLPPAAPVASAVFDDAEYAKENIDLLRGQMHEALVAQGLFADEADALLSTWELSYFQSTGKRLFFLVPREWTDRVLPLEISVPAVVTRVMVGRIELVGPRERELLETIAAGPASRPQRLSADLTFPEAAPRPADYRAYLDLGRFRDALLLDEQRRRPTAALDDFIRNYGLQARPAPPALPHPGID